MTKLQRECPETSPPPIPTDSIPADSEVAIWTRLVGPQDGTLSAEAARSLLAIGFGAEDKERLLVLAKRNQEGSLTDSERSELDNYCRVGRVLDMLHSKARRSLRKLPSRA